MGEKKDRRSRRDKLKDDIQSNMQAYVDKLKKKCEDRTRLNEADEQTITALEEQIKNINTLSGVKP